MAHRGAMRIMSLRRVASETQLSRRLLGEVVRAGQIPALRRGRAILVDVADVRDWWRSATAAQPTHAPASRAATDRIADAPDVAPGAPRAGAPTTPATPRGVATDPGPAA
jgi:hypothetical protein